MSGKYLFVGSLPPPYHGQAIAFKVAVDAINDKKKIVSTSFRSESFVLSIFLSLRYFYNMFVSRVFYRPDVVYFLCSRSKVGLVRDVWLLLLFYFSSARVVNHLHGSDFTCFIGGLPWLLRALVVKLYGRVDEHAVLIEPMVDQLKCINSVDKAKVIRNFYEQKIDDYFITRQVNDAQPIKVLYLSSILPSKGIFELVEAVKQVSASGIEIELYVAGGFLAEINRSLKDVTEEFYSVIAGCEAFIFFEGVVVGERKYQLLNEADIFVLPSYYKSEAVPLSIIEAMRMGCYIITTNYRYLPSLVVNGVNGRLVKPRSIEELVDALLVVNFNRLELAAVSFGNIKYAKQNYSESLYRANVKKFLMASG